ncbi:MAG: hypothetical protein JWQ97_4064 [Phenylobacterium sp.]|nr:hypothetical protein [Phenylobacterium sp.]
MSDVSVTGHNLAALFAGKITFSQFRDGEFALIKQNIASLPAAAQPAVTLIADSLAAGASAVVGIGMTAVGPILSDTTEHQATMVLNLLQLAGVPTAGPLSLAEQAILIQLINGLKAGLDHVGLKITAAGVTVVPTPAPAPAH